MAKGIRPEDLGAVITRELSTYSADITERVNRVGERNMRELVKLSKQNAPRRTGDFHKAITMIKRPGRGGSQTFIWMVKAPHYRLAHLLVHGHATKDGGRTKADPFLANALAKVLPTYEKEVEEAVRGD